ncbi:helix-turn-helix domain-containing protein [Mucilaginibacter sp. HD30]
MLELGKKIRLLRQKRNWSQSDVAQRLGISVAAFSKIETDVTDVSISRLEQIANVFDQTIAQLILQTNELSDQEASELDEARHTIKVSQAKIVNLQEHVITLYQELHQYQKSSISSS